LNPFGIRGASHEKQPIEIMKPTPLTFRSNRRSPMTDYNYHSIAPEGFNTNCERVSGLSLWEISRNYFKNEARHEFLGEAALFAVVIFTAFLPFINNAHTLVEFVRAISNY
jgi:hypothetical protein